MPASTGLKNSLNAIREISSEIYHQYIPIIDENTNIGEFAQPILEYPQVRNEFLNALMNRVVFAQYQAKRFKNPLKFLEDGGLPYGYAEQNQHINPIKGRKYNVNDFAGLLAKYEADVKTEYHPINADLQYPVTVSREELKKAFGSWGELQAFITGITNALYNGCYIDEYTFTKGIVSSAVKNNSVQTVEVGAINSQAQAKKLLTMARTMYANFQVPSSKYNGWGLVKEEDDTNVITWTDKEDIVLMIRSELAAYIDVNVFADAFNITDTKWLADRIVTVDDFDLYDEDGEKVFDGSNILGLFADRKWFKIKKQDEFMDEFYNANNRTTQYYLNSIKSYHYSLFANAVVFMVQSEDSDTPLDITTLPDMSVSELVALATEMGATGVSEANTKEELITAILNTMTKTELLEYVTTLQIADITSSNTKAEIVTALVTYLGTL